MRWVFGLVLSLLLFTSASAEVPQQLHYNGYLTNAVGEALDCPDAVQCNTTFDLTFRLYTAAVGGSPIWDEVEPGVAFYQGSFHVLLGDATPITAEILSGPVWLALKVNDNPEMIPRQQVTTAAFAIRAGTVEHAENAAQLGGLSPEDYASTESVTELQTIIASTDTTLNESQVDEMVANNGYAAQANLAEAQTALDELQSLVGNIDESTGIDISALQSQLASLETSLVNAQNGLEAETVARQSADEEEANTRIDVDLVLQGNLSALQGEMNALDPISKANLDCLEGQVAVKSGLTWTCKNGTSDGVGIIPPKPCDSEAIGQMYFDEVTSTLRVCDGTHYRKVKTCTEVCPESSSVACNLPIKDDCGAACGGLGTALAPLQCNPGDVVCGGDVNDACGNLCIAKGTALNSTQCNAAATNCGQAVIDNCGNSCSAAGEYCNLSTDICTVTGCKGAACAGTTVLDASLVVGGPSITGSSGASEHLLDATCAEATGAEVTYTITADTTGIMTVTSDLPGTNFDTVLSVRSECDNSLSEVACNDNFTGNLAQVSFNAVLDTTYVIVVDGAGGASGSFELAFTLCGDGVKDSDEDCDDGANGDNTDGCSDLCTSSRFISSKALDPTFSGMSWNKTGSGSGYHCANSVNYTCIGNRPSRDDSALAFCDCLDTIPDAANKTIPGSTGQCPEDVDSNFWTSGGGRFRVARSSEITANYSAGLNLKDELVEGDRVWACNRDDSGNYGVTTMAADGSTSSCCGGNDYCGYPSYHDRYTVCVDMDAPVGSGDCGSRCGL